MSLIAPNMTPKGNENLGESGHEGSSTEAKLAEISTELLQLQEKANQSYLEQGRLLLDAKSLFGKHGEWLGWLKENAPFSARHAQRLMQVAEWFGETTPESFLDFSKAYILTKIPKTSLDDFLGKYKSTDADVDPLQVVQNTSKQELNDAVREYLSPTGPGRSPGKSKKIGFNSPKASPEDHALDALSRLETTMSELVGDIMSWPPDNTAYGTVISEIRRLCEDTLGKLPSEDVQFE